ncbi:Galactosylgalactosylxylosylprotein 3-beta-glucuronosyltransferase 1 [Holothuria leucospilota]|uniref:Galactosylgalactosylxylosylprotein 3-beta-glucuronosyltransferase n=1 Tax=Holothuria leucospilota TaxID=206669 RepID=A0A9Q1CIL9_HOLLE|nr:Galactosylgalactosylxylosylprotein 3-beta-glucuronosyltransferase 1 [Holothuria leucospilota]
MSLNLRRHFIRNPLFLVFFYTVIFSTVTLWFVYSYGMNCTDGQYQPHPHSWRIKEVEILKTRTEGEEMNLPWIYAVTPTFSRPVQKAELVRLSSTFLHVKHFHWIVVEDCEVRTKLVANFLQGCGLNFTHLNVRTKQEYQLKKTDPNWKQPRGVDQRNAGIQWLLDNSKRLPTGVVYFADDDNTYSLQLFKEMRTTQKVSVWPVGLVGGLRFERPIVSSNGEVTKWYTIWEPRRPFAMDMAGFAVNLNVFISHPEARFEIRSRRGYVESSLLTSLGITLSDLEPKADNCTKICHVERKNPIVFGGGRRSSEVTRGQKPKTL